MKDHHDTEETYWAEWLKKKDSDPSEPQALPETEQEEMGRIVSELNNWDLPKLNVDSSWEKFKNLTEEDATITPKKKIIRPLIGVMIAVAAAIALLVIINWPTSSSIILKETQAGEQISFTLPDDSEVTLNFASSLSYDPNSWDAERMVQLEGEAFFKVAKGSKFIVQTSQGRVAVRGTQFNVKVRAEAFQVDCFEGSVEVLHDNANITEQLEAGMSLTIKYDKLIELQKDQTQSQPSWKEGYTRYIDEELALVFDDLEDIFGVTIIYPDSLKSIPFGGRIKHDNIKAALLSIGEKYNLDITYKSADSILISSRAID